MCFDCNSDFAGSSKLCTTIFASNNVCFFDIYVFTGEYPHSEWLKFYESNRVWFQTKFIFFSLFVGCFYGKDPAFTNHLSLITSTYSEACVIHIKNPIYICRWSIALSQVVFKPYSAVADKKSDIFKEIRVQNSYIFYTNRRKLKRILIAKTVCKMFTHAVSTISEK